MKGDFTRDTFKPAKHFSRVLEQQGRVTLDADTNEQSAILLHYLRTLARDLIGPYAAPVENPGFALSPSEGGSDIHIGLGRYYVDGILVENHYSDCLYTTQPDYPLPADDGLAKILKDKSADVYWLYLDVWERHITYIEDDSIREKALNGPDTCTRAKVMWQVKALSVPEPEDTQDIDSICAEPLKNLKALSDANLAARVDPGHRSDDACTQSPDSKYRGAENQLYRVEIHEGSATGTPTFKWSRNNASVAAAWLGTSGNDLQVGSSRGFEAGAWVEISNELLELHNLPGILVKLAKVEGDTLTVDAASVPAPDALAWSDQLLVPKVRLWDHRENETVELQNGAMRVKDGPVADPNWIDLEDGVQVAFAPGGEYRTGDYWLIPARVATGKIEWGTGDTVNAEFAPPMGIEHHYAPLGFAAWRGETLRLVSCGCEFEPLSSCFHLGSMAVGAHLLRTRIEQPVRVADRGGAATRTPVKRTKTPRTK